MHVIILAAGLSKRLLPFTKDRPKCLIPVFDGQTLLDLHFKQLNSIRPLIGEIRVIGGHGFPQLNREVEQLSRQYGIPAKAYFNDEYAQKNNCYTLLVGLQDAITDALIINSDDLYHHEILRRISHSPVTSLVIDNVKLLTDESMKVYVENGRVTHLNKKLDIKKSYGEYIGLARIERTHVAALRSALQHIVDTAPHLYYEDAFQVMAPTIPIGVTHTEGLYWSEVDTHEDLAQARILYRAMYAP